VERTPKGSYQVTELSLDRIQYLYETAIVIYSFVFSKAAENVKPNDFAELEKLMIKMEASIDGNDFELYITNVTKMAHKILKIAGNPMIERIASELMPTAERVQLASITYLPNQLKTVVTHLRQAYENIIKQNPEEAAKAFKNFCTAHIEVVVDSLNQSHKRKASN